MQNIIKHTKISKGFTLIEVMITVAIIGILATIALPSYREYVIRGHLVDGINALAAMQADMERFFQDNRTYNTVGTFTSPCSTGKTVLNFTLDCTATPTTTTYTLRATGRGPVTGFVYTVDQQGVRATPNVAASSGWATCGSAWITRRGQLCP